MGLQCLSFEWILQWQVTNPSAMDSISNELSYSTFPWSTLLVLCFQHFLHNPKIKTILIRYQMLTPFFHSLFNPVVQYLLIFESKTMMKDIRIFYILTHVGYQKIERISFENHISAFGCPHWVDTVLWVALVCFQSVWCCLLRRSALHTRNR